MSGMFSTWFSGRIFLQDVFVHNFCLSSPISKARPVMIINHPPLSSNTKLFHLWRRFIRDTSLFVVFTVFGYFKEYFPEISYSIIFVSKIDSEKLANFVNPTNIDWVMNVWTSSMFSTVTLREYCDFDFEVV